MIRKFRVWDKQIKKMAKVLNIDFENKIVQSVYWDSDHQCLIQANFDDVEFMQSTGLFDKNGVEIFEGDILKASSFAHWIGEVKYSVETQAYMFFDTWGEHKKRDVFLNQFDQLEVIGNIYENKDLLGDDENFNDRSGGQ